MTNIVLTNSQRTVTLDMVVGYTISKKTKYPVKRIPNRQLPIVDVDAKTTDPRLYTITAEVTTTVRDSVLSMESDRQVIRLQDGTIDDQCCFMDGSPDITNRVGYTDRQWQVRINLLSSAN